MNANLPEDPRKLVAVVVETAFDQNVGEPLRKALLSIENPLLNELLGAALDPLLARPLREALVRLAIGVIGGNTPEQMRTAARTWWSGQPTPVRQRWQRAVTNACSAWAARSAVPLEQPDWRAARTRLEEVLGKREASATRPARKEGALILGTAGVRRPDWFQLAQAGKAARRMARLWAALDTLLVDEPHRRVDAERAAAAAMLGLDRDANGQSLSNYLALWARALAETENASMELNNLLTFQPAVKPTCEPPCSVITRRKDRHWRMQRSDVLKASRGGSPEALIAHLADLR